MADECVYEQRNEAGRRAQNNPLKASLATVGSPGSSDESLMEESFEDQDNFDAGAIDLTTLSRYTKKAKKKHNYKKSRLRAAGKKRTADQGTQVRKEDLAAAMSDRQRIPPSPLLSSPTRSIVSHQHVAEAESDGITPFAKTDNSNAAQTEAQSLLQSFQPRKDRRSARLNASTSPRAQDIWALSTASGNPAGQETLRNLFSAPSAAGTAFLVSCKGTGAQNTVTAMPAARYASAARRHDRPQSEGVATSPRIAQSSTSSKTAAAGPRLSDWLLPDYGWDLVSLSDSERQGSRGYCLWGCGMPGGEHGVDCPGLMASRY